MRWNSITPLLLCASLPWACGGPETFEPNADEWLEDGELRLADGAEVARLELENGSSLYFLEVEPGAVGVLELQAPGAAGISSMVELEKHASPTDVFYAFSSPGTPVPERLLAIAKPSADFGVQGWANDLLGLAPVGRATCNNTDVQNWVNSFGYNDRGTPSFRLDQVPRTSSFFVDYVENWEPGYYFYEYSVGGNTGSVWSNIDRYYSYVAVCAIDTTDTRNPGHKAHPSITTPDYHNGHMGPQVRFSYRRQNTGGQYQTAAFKDFAASEVGMVFDWHFYTGTDWDWKTEIHWAGGDDSFDIAHAVEDL